MSILLIVMSMPSVWRRGVVIEVVFHLRLCSTEVILIERAWCDLVAGSGGRSVVEEILLPNGLPSQSRRC